MAGKKRQIRTIRAGEGSCAASRAGRGTCGEGGDTKEGEHWADMLPRALIPVYPVEQPYHNIF